MTDSVHHETLRSMSERLRHRLPPLFPRLKALVVSIIVNQSLERCSSPVNYMDVPPVFVCTGKESASGKVFGSTTALDSIREAASTKRKGNVDGRRTVESRQPHRCTAKSCTAPMHPMVRLKSILRSRSILGLRLISWLCLRFRFEFGCKLWFPVKFFLQTLIFISHPIAPRV